jgi:predicted AAA+ superfamily ATPase
MIHRKLANALAESALRFPVVTLTGPRQSGKTTLSRHAFAALPYRSLERPDTRAFAETDARAFLHSLRDGAVLDEIQRAPGLLSYIQSMVDEDPRPGRFVLTGSQNLALSAQVGQSLAGRTAILHLLPLDRAEIRTTTRAADELWTTLWRGGYPAIFDRDHAPGEWIAAYAATYLERDVRQLHAVGDLSTFQTFLGLSAGRVGNLINLSSLGSDAGITHPTAEAWLSVLEASFLVFRLRPWFRNLGKRLIKTPKLYFYDTGLLCWLLGIQEPSQLALHPLRGAVFENWVVSEIAKYELHRGGAPRLWFYRDQRRLEVDLLWEHAGRMFAVEIKSAATVPADAFAALAALRGMWREEQPLHPVLVYGGDERQRRSDADVVPWRDVDAIATAEG